MNIVGCHLSNPLILIPKFRNGKGNSMSTSSYFQIGEVIDPNVSLPCTTHTSCSTLPGVSVVRHELFIFLKRKEMVWGRELIVVLPGASSYFLEIGCAKLMLLDTLNAFSSVPSTNSLHVYFIQVFRTG